MSSTSSSSTSSLSSMSSSIPPEGKYVETTTIKDDQITIPTPALASSLSSSSSSSLPPLSSASSSSFSSKTTSSLSSSSSSSSSSYDSSSLPTFTSTPPSIDYVESSNVDNTVTVPTPAISSSLASQVIKTNADLPSGTILASKKVEVDTDTRADVTHEVTATLKNQESFVVEESTTKIEEIKKAEQERIAKIQRETNEKLRVVERRQRETQELLREAEANKALLIQKEQQMNKLCDQERVIIAELESKQNDLKIKQSEIEMMRGEVVELRRRVAAAQLKAEMIAKDAPAEIEKVTIVEKKTESEIESSEAPSSTSSKLSSIGSSIKSMLGLGSSSESTSEQENIDSSSSSSTTTVKSEKYVQSA